MGFIKTYDFIDAMNNFCHSGRKFLKGRGDVKVRYE